MARIATQPGPLSQQSKEKPAANGQTQSEMLASSLPASARPKDNLFHGFNGPGQGPERNAMMESTILSVTNDDGEVVDVNLNLSELGKAKADKTDTGTSSRAG